MQDFIPAILTGVSGSAAFLAVLPRKIKTLAVFLREPLLQY
jgi:hypothetical protein